MKQSILIALASIAFVLNISAQKQASSLLWEISGNGLNSTSYLYGTMHVSNKIAFHLGDTFFMALDNADMVCLESNPGNWIEEMYTANDGATMSRMTSSFGYGDGNFYQKLVGIPTPNKKDLEEALRQKHSLENGFLYRGSNQNKEYEENTYLDLFIYQYARKNKIKVKNLEDFSETNKLQIMAMIPDEDVDNEDKRKKHKKSYYSKWNKEMSVREAMEDAYRNGKLDIIDSITKITSKSDNYLHYFLHERNRIMATGIDTLAKKQKIFIGIGAAHLPGEKGVIQMLRKMGYTLRPIIRNTSELAKHKKDEIEKVFLDLAYEPFTTKDGYITVSIPGKLYETKGKSNDLQYFFPDMVNGGNFFISRFQTYFPLKYFSPKEWQSKIDSLLFENIEGKIIEQKEIKINGFDAIQILNETRRGDFQQRLIVFTPLEVIFFKMSGTGKWAKIYGDRFIKSVKINQPTDKETVYTSSLNDFNITFPGAIINTEHATSISGSPPKYNVQSFTPIDSSYYIFQSDWLNDFDYIEEDSFELTYLFEVFSEEFDSIKEIKTLKTENNAAVGYLINNEGDSIFMASVLWKNFYYFMAAKSTEPKAMQFFNSLNFTNNYIEDDYVTYHDSLLRYTVKTPVTPPEMDDLIRFVRRKSKDKKEDWDYVKQFRNFFYTKNYESINVKYLKHSDYYHFETLKEFWKDELEAYLETSYIIKEETYDNNDTLPTAHVIVTDTGSQKVIELKKIINKGLVYTISTAYNARYPRSKFISTFFESFTPTTDVLLGKTITVSNAPMFFADLASGDSLRIERAVNLSNRITFTKDHVDSMIYYIDNFEFPEGDKEETAPYLIKQLGYIKDPKIISYLKGKYEASTDQSKLQFACLKALGKYGTKKAYKVMNTLLIQEPPITSNENPIESFFYYLDDSLELTSKLYPDLWDLMLYADYRESVYQLSANLLENKRIKSSSYKREKPLILREAKSETSEKNSVYSSIPSVSVSLDDNDYYYSFGDRVDYKINLVDQYDITLFLKLLMPYYKKDKKVQNYVNSLINHDNEKYRFVSTIMLTNANVDLQDSIYTNLSESVSYRLAFYKSLKFIGKENKFDTTFLSQQKLMESAILASSSVEQDDSLQFVEKRFIRNKYEEGYVYFFKHQSSYNNKWYISYAGLQPKNIKLVNSDISLDYVNVKAQSVYTESKIIQCINDWVKELELVGRARASQSGSDD